MPPRQPSPSNDARPHDSLPPDREAFILANLPRAEAAARAYHGRGVEDDDLRQYAAAALVQAVRREPTSAALNLTTVGQFIHRALKRDIADRSRLIRLPVHIHDRGKHVRACYEQASAALGRSPTVDQVAAICGEPLLVVRAHLVVGRPVSLDDPTRADWLASRLPTAPDPAEEFVERDPQTIEVALSRLPPRAREVVVRRFGLDGGPPQTGPEIGAAWGVTPQRIFQIETKAFAALKDMLGPLERPEVSEPLEASPDLPHPPTSRDAIRRVLDRVSARDQVALTWLWTSRRRPTVASVAKRLGLSEGEVQAIERRALSLIPSPVNGSESAPPPPPNPPAPSDQPARPQPEPSGPPAIHPGWRLTPSDRDSGMWASRRVAQAPVQRPTQPPSASAVGVPSVAASAPTAATFSPSKRYPTRGADGPASPSRGLLPDDGWQAIADIARALPDDQRALVEARFGLNGRARLALAKILREFAVAPEQVMAADDALLDHLARRWPRHRLDKR